MAWNKKEKDELRQSINGPVNLTFTMMVHRSMTPYVRCKLTDEVIMARGSDVHVDHINGDRTDNSPDNWSFVKDWANAMKADAKTFDVLEERLEKVLKTIRKYK